MNRDIQNAYLLHAYARHTFSEYATAWAMAGDLKLQEEPKPVPGTVYPQRGGIVTPALLRKQAG